MRPPIIAVLCMQQLWVASFLAGCPAGGRAASRTRSTHSEGRASHATAASPSAESHAAQAPIGSSMMLQDGTLVLDLRAEGGGPIGEARFVYPPSHADYSAVLKHLGGLTPGQSKPVPPWP